MLNKLKIGVLVSGGGTNLQAIIDSIENGTIRNAEIVTVAASNPDAYALKRAEKHGIPSVAISRKDFDSLEKFDLAICEHMKSCGVELIVMAGFLSIIGENLLNEYEGRIINIHPSLIPSFCGKGYYGLRVHEAALERGVKITGATVHFVNEIPDGGPIIIQKAVDVKDGDTPETLQKRVMEEAEWIILPKAIDMIANGEIKI
ncbi:MAG TPA: phosphoribosylglycinamide formyltransferase [Firmicutes bacterium]|nr:phosphoribosylglycinamide formyltransferase [Bacillota bacterium]